MANKKLRRTRHTARRTLTTRLPYPLWIRVTLKTAFMRGSLGAVATNLIATWSGGDPVAPVKSYQATDRVNIPIQFPAALHQKAMALCIANTWTFNDILCSLLDEWAGENWMPVVNAAKQAFEEDCDETTE